MGRSYKQDVDRASIEQLAATLESKIGSDDLDHLDDDTVTLADRRRPPQPAAKPDVPLPLVLVAHADPGLRGAVRAALERHFQVLEAADGEEAWETLAAQRDVRLLLTGTRLPRLDGIELIRRLRRPGGPAHLVGLPVMVYAEQEDPATKQAALLAGANDYLAPDIEPEALLARVQARHRLFEQSRRAMNLTGTMPTSRAARTETGNGAGTPVRAPRGEAAAPSAHERPIWVEARGAARAVAVAPRGWAERLYRISSTTTITLTATVLVILAITLILLLNQTPPRSSSTAVGRLDGRLAPAANMDRAPAPAPQGSFGDTPEQSDAARQSVPAPAGSAANEAPARATSPTSAPGKGGEAGAAGAPPAWTDRDAPAEARRPAAAESRPAGRPASESSAPARSPAHATAPSREEAARPPASLAAPAPRADTEKAVAPESPPTPPVAGVERPRDTLPAAKPPETTAASAPAQPPEPAPVERAAGEIPVAASAPAAASPTPRSAPARLSREELAALLQRFVYVYEAGDIEQFMALLADNVQTNDRVTRQAVREDYDRLFRTTDLREMRVEAMSWDVEGDQAHGWGEFEVRVRRQGDGAVYHYQGSLTLLVRKAGGRPRIERLYHSERRASR